MKFKQRLAAGDRLIGLYLSLASPDIAEMAALAGFDWLWIDLEHSRASLTDVQRMIQAVAGRSATLVRVPWNDPVWIKRVLDLGCDGVIVPQVRSADEAAQAVRACLYPPAGERSVGMSRAQQYGMDFQRYVENANSEICIILQIEHRDAVGCLDEILAVPGYEAVLAGPYDLSGSFGLLGQVSHPKVMESLAQIGVTAKRHGKATGIFVADVEAARAQAASGFNLIAVGSDAMYFWKGAQQAVRQLKS